MHEQSKISRSISLPVKPQFPEQKTLKRSNEKEKLYSENENSMQYLYEDDELRDDHDDDDDDDDHLKKFIDNDKISLDIKSENIVLKRNTSNQDELLNAKIYHSQRRRRRHSSCCESEKIKDNINNSYNNSNNNSNVSNKNKISYADDDNDDDDYDDDDDDDDDIIDDYKDGIKNFNLSKEGPTVKINNETNNNNNNNDCELRNFAVPGTSGGGTDQSNTLKQRYKKDKRRASNTRKASLVGLGGRKGSQGWFGSTIEINDQETNESCSYNEDNDEDDIIDDRFIRRSISRNINRRLIRKDGYQNVSFKNIPRRSLRYCKDLITTLIELDWSYVLSIFVIIFVGSWIFFAVLWYLIGKAHGDLDFDPITGERLGEGKKPCVRGAYDMIGMFIHSLELQTTIGFGEKYPTEECPEGVFLFVFQIISSIAFEGAIVAVVYAKMARPVKLLSKFTFSKTACICLRDGKFCLIFRVCDPREQKCIGTKIRAYLVADATTPEGETMKVNTELQLEGDGSGIIIWPETICHAIDKNSPFYKFSAIDFHTKNFEVFISLFGHSPLTGQATESRTSYLPHEILWGQRFPNIIDYSQIKESYVVDYNNFHTTIAANIPFKSAYHLERLKL